MQPDVSITNLNIDSSASARGRNGISKGWKLGFGEYRLAGALASRTLTELASARVSESSTFCLFQHISNGRSKLAVTKRESRAVNRLIYALLCGSIRLVIIFKSTGCVSPRISLFALFFFFSFLMASFASNGKNEGEQKKKRERNVYRFRFRVRENHCSLSFLLTFDIWVKPMHTSEKKKERKRKRENSDMRISYLSSSCTWYFFLRRIKVIIR